MKIAVCDDERMVCEQIAEWICLHGDKTYSVSVFDSGDRLLESGEKFDMIFLDIQMDGTNGIETAELIRKEDHQVILIFVTGIKEHVFEAFDVMAFHYLLKPVKKARFMEVFERAIKEAERKSNDHEERQLHIRTREHHFTVAHSDILYLENQGRKVKIHTKEKVIEAYAVMKELQQQLGKNFYRCHRGYLVNMEHIAEYDSSCISMDNGEYVWLAKERYGGFIKEYMRYLKSGGASGV